MKGEWISARDAREMVSPGCKFNGPTTDAIRRYAAAGMIRTRAASFSVEGEGKKKSMREHSIAPDFWELLFEKEDWWQGLFIGVRRAIDWEIRCEALGVTFERSGIEAMNGSETSCPAVRTQDSVPTKTRGRPAGSGGFAIQDDVVVEKMREYISDHPGTSPHFAAGEFVKQAAGNAGDERKQRRLADRYRKAYPT